MRKYIAILCLLFAAGTGFLHAQGGYPLPDATVGTPYAFDFFQGVDLSAIQAEFQQLGYQLTLSFSVPAGGLPPGITVSPNLLAFGGTPTAAGTFNFTANLTESLTDLSNGQVIFNQTFPFTFTLTVTAPTGPTVSVSPAALIFPFPQGATAVMSQSLLISNRGQQTQTANVSTSTSSGVNWLSASGGASVAPFSSSSVTVTVNPNGLLPGTYAGTVSITLSPAGQTSTVAVTATVSSANKQILVTQSGARFQTVAGGGVPPSQSISVFNGGPGNLNITASASTLSGAGWLSVSPSSGTATSSTPAPISLNVNPSGLAAGDYYGQIQISSPGVDNSPQIVTVVLNVAAPGANLGAFVSATGLIFVGQAGGTNPAAKSINITTPSPSALMFSASPSFAQGNNWFTVQPPSGSVTSSSPVQLKVQPVISGLATGVYNGQVTLVFSDKSIHQIAILLVIVPGGSTAGVDTLSERPLASSCTPTKLIPVFTLLGQSFTTVAAWPTAIEVTVVDDCGNFLTSGTVVTSFSSGDPPLSLQSLRDGRWSATWQPRASASQVTITANAQETSPAISGAASIGGALAANPSTPVISAGGAVSAASYAANQPLAPGGFVSIFGAHLSSGLNRSPTLPLATQLGATQAVLAGRQLPLQFASDGQINAIVPYDVPANATQQLIIVNGPAYSLPEPVIVSPAQPAVFTTNASGKGAGIFVGQHPDGSQFLVNADNPATAGDALIIYCAGLGAVDPPVSAGSAAPLSPLSNAVSPVTVTIGGQPAQFLFAGLAPGFAGLYQVNVVIPSGITPGNEVPLVITVAGQPSTAVTIAIQ